MKITNAAIDALRGIRQGRKQYHDRPLGYYANDRKISRRRISTLWNAGLVSVGANQSGGCVDLTDQGQRVIAAFDLGARSRLT
jgi:ribosomal protein S19E (S16A)